MKKLTIEELREIAIKKCGKCISESYDCHEKTEWECCNGHRWFSFAREVKTRTWCPFCSGSISEEKCRYIIEKLTNLKFPRKNNIFGSKKQLDGYNEKFNLAFEYNGEYHYKNSTLYSKFPDRVLITIKRDKEKDKVVKKNSIKLITIPYFENKDNEHLFEFIKKEIIKVFKINVEVDFYDEFFDEFIGKPSFIKEAQDLAVKNKGKCLSTVFFTTKEKLKWECEFGHKWETKIGVIRRGFWCPECSCKKILTIEEMMDLAKTHDGKCLSKYYVDSQTELLWECKEGHKWLAKPNTIKNGNWCAECSGIKRLTIDEMKQLAIKNGGKCLSEKYINSHTKLLWECEKGHQWETKPYAVKQGHWCPKCLKKEKLTIEEMKIIANKNEGECLSEKYVNSRTKLLWKCKNKHEWYTTPNIIKDGHWCPKCKNERRKKCKEGL